MQQPEERMDSILSRMEAALRLVDMAHGSIVRLPKAELELLTQFEGARDLMMSVLQSENKDRVVLQRVFGGDCVRVSRVRAVLDSVEFSDTSNTDQRAITCRSACESVEKVLADLGLGLALRCAQAHQKELLHKQRQIAAVKGPCRAAGGRKQPQVREQGQPTMEPSQQRSTEEEHWQPPVKDLHQKPPKEESCHGSVKDQQQNPPGVEQAQQTIVELRQEPSGVDTAHQVAQELRQQPDVDVSEQVLLEVDRIQRTMEALLPVEELQQEPADAEREQQTMDELPQDFAEMEEGEQALQEEQEPTAVAVVQLNREDSADSPAVVASLARPETPQEAPSADRQSLRAHGDAAPLGAGAPSKKEQAAAVIQSVRRGTMARKELQEKRQQGEAKARAAPTCRSRGSDLGLKQRTLAPADVVVAPVVEQKETSSPSGSRPLPARRIFEAGAAGQPPDPDEDHGTGMAGLPAHFQMLVQRLYAFYAGTDGTSDSGGLGNSRFRTFLKDCGVMGIDVSGDPSLVASRGTFAPSARTETMGLSGSARQLVQKAAGTTSRPRTPEASEVAKAPAPQAPCSSSAAIPNNGKLPLKLFSEPPLNFVQVDLEYVQAINATRRDRQQGQPGQARSHMTLDAFVWALTDIALFCHRRGIWEQGGKPDDDLKSFCALVLRPLRDLLGLGEFDAESTRAILLEPDVAGLVQRGQRGLEAIFKRYACSANGPEPYQKGHWNAQAFKRFANDADLVAELSVTTIQRLFNACVQHEVGTSDATDGKMSYNSFQLALLMIAQRIDKTPQRPPPFRLAILFLRMSVANGARELGAAARSVLGSTLPSSAPTRRASGGQRPASQASSRS